MAEPYLSTDIKLAEPCNQSRRSDLVQGLLHARTFEGVALMQQVDVRRRFH